MNTQIKAGFKKEILAFTRTKRLIILAIVLVGWSVLSPILLKGLGSLMDSMSDTYSELGMDVSTITEELGSLNATVGLASAVQDLASVGILLFLLLICSFAGGEQKKRSVIIPRASGLTNGAYLFPKFILYPATIFILSIIASLSASGTAAYAFENNDIVLANVLMGGAVMGVYLMLYVCMHLCLGTATGQAGMSAAICIAGSMILPGIFVLTDSIMYNPFTLHLKAVELAAGGKMNADVLITAAVTLVIMALLYLVALFAQNAKRIDNSGDEIFI